MNASLFAVHVCKENARNYSEATSIERLDEVLAAEFENFHTGDKDSTKNEVKNNFLSNVRYSLGVGITAAFNNNNYQGNFQIDFINKDDVHLGIIVGYSNVTLLWPKSNRTCALLNFQYDLLDTKKKNNIYFNLGAGAAYFSDAFRFNFMAETKAEKISYAPVGHVGFGYFHRISKKSGVFCEIGLGGPYFFNTGVFF